MQYSLPYRRIFALTLLSISLSAFAEPTNVPLEIKQRTIQDETEKQIEQISTQVEQTAINTLPTELPSEPSTTKNTQDVPKQPMSKAETIAYLQAHPDEFEQLLQVLLLQGNAASLEELLPIYKQYPNHDPSVIDWGNAIITARKGNLNEAIVSYRKLNAALPEVNIIRFQMAMALFYNRQFDAAQSEFEALRSSTTNEADLQAINQYLDAISRQDKWEFYGSLSLINDKNITNSAPVGTKIDLGDGKGLTQNEPFESGKGINYAAYADKKWLSDNRLFTALHLNTYGKYYVDNKKFNDASVGAGVGVGYQTAITELELQPFMSKRWYGGGSNGDGKLDSYANTKGIKLSASQWLNPQWRYQGVARISKSDYQKPYEHNDGTDKLLANTMVYIPNQRQYWTLGVDYSSKDAQFDRDSYNRKGVRLGWGQSWDKGFSTRINLGYAKRDYEGADVTRIKRENKEFDAGLTVWNRGFSIMGLTPRLSWDYSKVSSNSPFEEYDKHNVSVELTKTF